MMIKWFKTAALVLDIFMHLIFPYKINKINNTNAHSQSPPPRPNRQNNLDTYIASLRGILKLLLKIAYKPLYSIELVW